MSEVDLQEPWLLTEQQAASDGLPVVDGRPTNDSIHSHARGVP